MIVQPHQGFRNYPTWAVSLWLNNDEGLYNQMQDLIRESRGDVFVLEDKLKAWAEEFLVPEVGLGPAADILTWGFAQVDWREIAESELSA